MHPDPGQTASVESGYGQLLRNRPFLALWLAQVVSQIADNLLYFTLLVEVYRRTGANTAVSALVLAFTIPALTFGLVAGVLVDRTDKRTILLATNIGRALISVLFVVGATGFAPILVLGFAASILRQFFMPAEAAALPRLLPPRQLFAANSLFTLTYNASFIVGFASAGPLLKAAGANAVYVLAAIFFAAASALCAALPLISPGPRQGPITSRVDQSRLVLRELREGWAFLRSDAATTRVMIQLALAWSLSGITAAIAPGYATTVLGLNEEDAFFLVLPAGVGVVLGSLIIGHYGWRVRREVLIAAGFLGIGAAVVLLATAGRIIGNLLALLPWLTTIHPAISAMLVAVMALSALLGFSNATAVIPANTILQERTPDALRGRVFSVLNALGNVGSTAPVLLVGILADLVGVRWLMIAIGVGVAGAGIASLAWPVPAPASRVDTPRDHT